MHVAGRVGGPNEGGYEYRANIVCDVDVAAMTDLERMRQFIAHVKKRCVCYTNQPSKERVA